MCFECMCVDLGIKKSVCGWSLLKIRLERQAGARMLKFFSPQFSLLQKNKNEFQIYKKNVNNTTKTCMIFRLILNNL